MPIHIIKAQPIHVPLITEFQMAMARETEGLELNAATLLHGVENLFQNPVWGNYFVAQSGDEIVGCMLTLFEWSDWRNARVVWIHSVYVKPEFRGKKVFSALYNHIKLIVENDPGIAGLRLYVDKTNTHAAAVYSKLGMSDQHYNMFEWLKS